MISSACVRNCCERMYCMHSIYGGCCGAWQPFRVFFTPRAAFIQCVLIAQRSLSIHLYHSFVSHLLSRKHNKFFQARYINLDILSIYSLYWLTVDTDILSFIPLRNSNTSVLSPSLTIPIPCFRTPTSPLGHRHWVKTKHRSTPEVLFTRMCMYTISCCFTSRICLLRQGIIHIWMVHC